MPIAQTVAEIRPIFNFSRWRLSAILNLFYAFGQRTKSTWWSCDYAKCDWNRCSNFDNTRFNILLVKLENAYSRPQNRGFRGFNPKVGSSVNDTQDKYVNAGAEEK